MNRKLSALIFFISAIHAGYTFAGPADYVYTPTVGYGEKEIDLKYGSATQKDGTFKQVTSFGVGYGVKEYWFTEVYLKHERNGNQNIDLAEWENKFQLTETGKWPVDIGFITELEAPLNNSDAPWEVKLGPLFQKELGKFQLNGNLLFERAFGKSDENGYPTEFGYQWQAKYRMQPTLELGLQGMGEMGKWDEWDSANQQNHRMGPAVFGKFALGNRQALKYNATLLYGTSDVAPNHTFRMQLEYEF